MLGVTVWGCLSARCPWVLTENRRKTEGTEKGSEHGSCRGYGSGEKETSGPPSWWGLGLDDCGRLLLGHCLHTCRHQVSLAGREGHGVPLAWSWHNSELWSDKPVCLFYSISGRPIKSDYYLFFLHVWVQLSLWDKLWFQTKLNNNSNQTWCRLSTHSIMVGYVPNKVRELKGIQKYLFSNTYYHLTQKNCMSF